MTCHVGSSSHRAVSLGYEILVLPSFHKADLTYSQLPSHIELSWLGGGSVPARIGWRGGGDMRYLKGAATWQGRERSSSMRAASCLCKTCLWMEGNKGISHPKLTMGRLEEPTWRATLNSKMNLRIVQGLNWTFSKFRDQIESSSIVQGWPWLFCLCQTSILETLSMYKKIYLWTQGNIWMLQII